MDSDKLLRILKDAQQDEQSLTVDSKIEGIRSSIAQNTSEAFKTAEEQLKDLVSQTAEKSIIYNYSPSEELILQNVKGAHFFGKGLIEKLQQIFNERPYEMIGKIDEYRSQRNDFIQKSQKLTSSLTDMGFSDYRPDSYEVGIILPDTQSDFDTLIKRLREFNLLLSAVYEASDGNHRNVKITRLSNGSLEFFSLQNAGTAVLLTTLLLNITTVWEKISRFRRKAEDNEKDKDLSPEAKQDMKAILQKETENIKKQIVDELPNEFLKNLKKERSNEIKNSIGISINAIFHWIQVGIKIDITPIRLNAENASPESKKQGSFVRDTNAKIQEIYKLPEELRKLPFNLPEAKQSELKIVAPKESLKPEEGIVKTGKKKKK